MIESYKNIPLVKTLNRIESFFTSEVNKDNLYNISFYQDKKKLNDHLLLLKEYDFFLDGHIEFNLVECKSLERLLNSLNRQITFSSIDFVYLIPFLQNCVNIKQTLKSVEKLSKFYDINEDYLDLTTFPNLLKKYQTSFSNDGYVNDEASANLLNIRNNISRIKQSISSKYTDLRKRYSNYLTEEKTFKNDYETLSVHSYDINKVEGIVLEQSKSGRTLFVLPKEVILLQNELEKLYSDEETEIAHILDMYTKELRQNVKSLANDYYLYNRFDLYIGLVKFSIANHFTVPQMDDDSIELNNLFHPEIEYENVVKNSIKLEKDGKHILMLSGPNAGGKSVFFKSFGLSFYLFMLGLPVNCSKESKLIFVDNVFLVLGDDDSVTSNLSRFTAHLVKLNEIVSKATNDSLVIIDEICSGTSPKEGEAIAVGFIEKFLEKNLTLLLSTHYEGIKKYALEDSRIISGTMQFDKEKLSPTYKLILNQPGSSYAIEACYKVNVDKDVIKIASKYLKDNLSVEDKLTKKLEKELNNNITLNEKLKDKIKEYDSLLEKRNKSVNATLEQENKIREKAEEKIDKLVEEKIKVLEAMWNDKTSGLDFKKYSEIRGALNKYSQTRAERTISKAQKKEQNNIKVNDLVIYNDIHNCVVTEIKNNKVKISVNGLIVTTTLDKLTYQSSNSSKNTTKLEKRKILVERDSSSIDKISTMSSELNVIGLTKDEAIRDVESFISKAIERNLTQVRIIHGKGSFILRNAISDYLKKQNCIKSYRSGGEYEGGNGATVVLLK